MAESSKGTRPGRGEAVPVPRGERRRAQIASAAEAVFLANGYAETKMQMVADAAGASKETLYRHFGSKEDLFRQVVDNRARALLSPLDAEVGGHDSIGSVLTEVATTLLRAMTSPETVALLRIVVAEMPRNPTLGHIFHAVGPERTVTRLAQYLQDASTRGAFAGNPRRAAAAFLGAVTTQTVITRLLLPELPAMEAEEIAERAAIAVEMFEARFGTKAVSDIS